MYCAGCPWASVTGLFVFAKRSASARRRNNRVDYEPLRVHVGDATQPIPVAAAVVGAFAIAWVMCLGMLYFVTPIIAQSIALGLADTNAINELPAAASLLSTTLAANAMLDVLCVAPATWWAIQLSRLWPLPVAVLFAFSLVAVRTQESGDLPRAINMSFPPWYE